MYIVESSSYDPYINLAIEEFLFTHQDKGSSCFMLWQNDNTIVVGNYQNTIEEIDAEYVKKAGIKVARRLSGGGAVYHDLQNLNYSIITDRVDIESVSFDTFVLPLQRVLRKLGLDARLTGRNDVTIEGKKICGNAQKIAHGRVLHHGCIMLGTDLQVVQKALKPKKGKILSSATGSDRSAVATIRSFLKEPVTIEQFKRMLIEEMENSEKLEPFVFSAEEVAEIVALCEHKYSTWEWNYGTSPKYELQREKRFPGGTVGVRMNVKKGKISEIRFYGDFFANKEIMELENALKGQKVNESLKTFLEEQQAGTYLKGVSAAQLAELILME